MCMNYQTSPVDCVSLKRVPLLPLVAEKWLCLEMSRIQASLQIVRLIVFVPLSVQFITN